MQIKDLFGYDGKSAFVAGLGYRLRNNMTAAERRWMHAHRYDDVTGNCETTVDVTASVELGRLSEWGRWNRRVALLRMGGPTARRLYWILRDSGE